MTNYTYSEELEFDLPTKLLEELVVLFENMPSGELNSKNVNMVEEEQGVYQLLKNDELVYIGKTDSDAGLKKRLHRHASKIQSRLNLDVNEVSFKAIRVFVFTAMDLESLLIRHYKESGISIDWQNSGFGSNDPGIKRDTTTVKPDNFDAKYPIDLSTDVSIDTEFDEISIAELLIQAKKQLPYNIRFQRSTGRRPHRDLDSTTVTAPETTINVRDLLKLTKNALGASWQITVLPGYVIVYKERAPNKYPSGEIIESE